MSEENEQPASPPLPIIGPETLVLSRKLLDEYRPWGESELWLRELENLEEHSSHYPDGSYEIFWDRLSDSQRGNVNQLRSLLLDASWAKREAENRPTGSEGFQTVFRGLWGDPIRNYTLWYPDSAQVGLGDRSLLVGPGAWCPISPGESDRHSLSIAIVMLRKPSEECRQYIAQVLALWFASVSRSGAMDEGSVRPAENVIEWQGRAAFLKADFSQAGQHTLNWLTLWLVNHTRDFAIECISYGNPDAPLVTQASRRTRPLREALPTAGGAAAVAPQVVKAASCETGMRVVRDASFDPARASFEIDFSDSLEEQQQREIEEAVRAWLLVGLHGGFSGHFAFFDTLEWSGSADKMRWSMDLGDAEIEPSLAVLQRVLAGLSKEVAGVEALVLK